MTNVLGRAELRRVVAAFPTGAAGVGAMIDGEPAGLATDSFVSASLDPPVASVCIAHISATWPPLQAVDRFGISVLGDHQEAVRRQLSPRDGARVAGLSRRVTHGAVVPCAASAWFDCSIDQEIPAGDHDVVWLDVHELALPA